MLTIRPITPTHVPPTTPIYTLHLTHEVSSSSSKCLCINTHSYVHIAFSITTCLVYYILVRAYSMTLHLDPFSHLAGLQTIGRGVCLFTPNEGKNRSCWLRVD